jgi:hypothetical protein
MSNCCPVCTRKFKALTQHLRQSQCGRTIFPEQGSVSGPPNYENPNVPSSIESEWPDSNDDNFFNHDDSEPHNEELNSKDNQDVSNERFPIPEGAIIIEDDRTKSSHTCTDQEKGYVRLLTFIEQHCLPLYVYDDLLDLLKSISYTRFDFSAIHPKRQTILKKLSARFVCPQPKPVLVPMERNSTPDPNQLLDNNKSVHVLRFDVRRQIKDLLASEIFHDMNNLVVDPSDPFSMYKPLDGCIGELYSGDWYHRTYKSLITDPSKEMLIGVKLYCDKTGTDSMMMRHGLEPVMLTLTIIKQSVQQKNFNAWKHIGFIPDLDQRSKAEKKYASNNEERKGRRPTRNYHRCLDAVLQAFNKIQEEGGMDVFVRIGPYIKKVRAKLPVAIIVGDAKSGDLWTCRILHHKQNRMSRACYTPVEKCSDHRVICRWVKQSEQEKLLRGCMELGKEKDATLREKLKLHSTIRCYSCLFRMDFGANPHGQFRACTIDMMHLFENGWVSYVCQAFIRPMRTLNRTMAARPFGGKTVQRQSFFPSEVFSTDQFFRRINKSDTTRLT